MNRVPESDHITTQTMIRAIAVLDRSVLAVFAYITCTDRSSVTRARWHGIFVDQLALIGEDLGMTPTEVCSSLHLLHDIGLLVTLDDEQWAAAIADDLALARQDLA